MTGTMSVTGAPPQIKVLVVDDSPVARQLLSHILGSDPDIRVTGVATGGRDAMDVMRRQRPDVITMDINMPEMDGFEATRAIMETDPVPIVIVTGRPDSNELEMSFKAIEAGALAVLQKPNGIGHADYRANAAELITTVKLMSEVKVVKRWARKRAAPVVLPQQGKEPLLPDRSQIKVIAMGASTGGPPAIEQILSRLPGDFAVPLLIVQHMSPGFVHGFAEWLGQKSPMAVHVASDRDLIIPGHVYVAPDGLQMKVGADGRIVCVPDAPENGTRPSVSCLFRSVAEVFGKDAAGVLLTGMGSDGADGLKAMKMKGAVTIAQDNETSVVFGMPGEAVKLEAATYVLPPDRIAALLTSLGASKTKKA